MNDTVKEWVDKAERDYATATRELARASNSPNMTQYAFILSNALKNY